MCHLHLWKVGRVTKSLLAGVHRGHAGPYQMPLSGRSGPVARRAPPFPTSLGLVCLGTSLLKQVLFCFLKKFTEIEFIFHRTHPFKVYNVWS